MEKENLFCQSSFTSYTEIGQSKLKSGFHTFSIDYLVLSTHNFDRVYFLLFLTPPHKKKIAVTLAGNYKESFITQQFPPTSRLIF